MQRPQFTHTAQLELGEAGGTREACTKVRAVTLHLHYREQSALISNQTAKSILVTADRTH